jgi:hypothetical protein
MKCLENPTAEGPQNDATVHGDRNGGLYLVPMFDDYRYRGPQFESLCLYDYASLVYKKSAKGGVPFEAPHPQAGSHSQVLRKGTLPVPNMVG